MFWLAPNGVENQLSIADARVAHEMLEGSRSRPRGKIVLSVGE
jgi:hypothetical protein